MESISTLTPGTEKMRRPSAESDVNSSNLSFSRLSSVKYSRSSKKAFRGTLVMSRTDVNSARSVVGWSRR